MHARPAKRAGAKRSFVQSTKQADGDADVTVLSDFVVAAIIFVSVALAIAVVAAGFAIVVVTVVVGVVI